MREKRKESSEELHEALWQRAAPALEAFNSHTTEWRARLHVRSGRGEEQLSLLTAEVRADLLVIGHFGLHHPRRSDKILPNRVLQAATCPRSSWACPRTCRASAASAPPCARHRRRPLVLPAPPQPRPHTR